MLIHEHSERVGATTGQAGGTIASVAIPPRRDPMALTTAELAVFGFGFLLLGVLIGWAINEARLARVTGQRDRLAKRWARSEERFGHAKTVIVRMVEEEAEARRLSVVA